jgi:Transglutaminase-like superfamily
MPIAFPPTLYSRAPLMSGDAGVEQTINQMRSLVDDALRDPAIIRMATDIVRSVPAFDDYAEANALYDWVRRNIRFTKDPVNKEKLYPPAELLKIRAGDCDDISMLLGTLLMAVGYPARLMTVAANGDEFSHVYVEANLNGQWIPLDPARYDSQFGVPPPAFTRARWWSLSDNSQGDLSGTKIHVHPGATAHVHMAGLGAYPRYRSHVSGLGDDTTPAQSTSATIATIEQGAADIIRASQGQAASPFDFSAAGPWTSFQTKYSPYGVPGAGYSSPPNVQVSASSNWVLWAALAVGGLLLLGGRR